MKVVLGQGVVGIVLTLLSLPALAADAARVTLRWNSPDECPDDAELVAAVEGFLGQKLSEAREQELSVTVNVAGADQNGFAAKLRFKSREGVDERSLEHPDCRKLMEGAALVIALTIDPERVKARQQTADKQAPPSTPPSPPVSSAEPVAASEPRDSAASSVLPQRDEAAPSGGPAPASRSAELTSQLELFGFAGGGALPSLGPGLGAAFGLRSGRFELGVAGQSWLARTATIQQAGGAEIELSLWTAALRACGWPLQGTWSLRACVASSFGDLSGAGQGIDNARTRHALYSALLADVSLRYGHGRLAPLIGVAGGWAFARPAFGVGLNTRPTEVFRPQPWTVQVFVGLAYRL